MGLHRTPGPLHPVLLLTHRGFCPQVPGGVEEGPELCPLTALYF